MRIKNPCFAFKIQKKNERKWHIHLYMSFFFRNFAACLKFEGYDRDN